MRGEDLELEERLIQGSQVESKSVTLSPSGADTSGLRPPHLLDFELLQQAAADGELTLVPVARNIGPRRCETRWGSNDPLSLVAGSNE